MQYEGTGARIQEFIDKARTGRPFTVSVIGGSVSKGRGLVPAKENYKRQSEDRVDGDGSVEGAVSDTPLLGSTEEKKPDQGSKTKDKLGADTLYSPENLHVLIFDWLNATFPHPENRLVNGAQGGVGSGYFSWCFSESRVWLLIDD